MSQRPRTTDRAGCALEKPMSQAATRSHKRLHRKDSLLASNSSRLGTETRPASSFFLPFPMVGTERTTTTTTTKNGFLP